MEVERGTFNQVKEIQNILIFENIQMYYEQNETVSPDHRDVFWDIVALSLFGVENNYPFILYYQGNEYNIGSLADWIREIPFITDDDLDEQKRYPLLLKGEEVKVPLKDIWKSLRKSLNKPIAQALHESIGMSAEVFSRKGGSFEFSPDTKINID